MLMGNGDGIDSVPLLRKEGKSCKRMGLFTVKWLGNAGLLCSWIMGCSMLIACTASEKAAAGKKSKTYWVKQFPLDYKINTGADSVTVVPGADYKAGSFKQWLAGTHYRQTWTTPVTVPVIDIGTEKGGLTPFKSGGNMQSLTLHLETADGKRYVLRSVQKNPVKTLPEGLRGTFVVNVARDQVSTLHPYGALAAATLAEAAGVYHTNPKLVFLPSTDALGEFRQSHGNMLAIFEEKPEEDWSHELSFGNSHKIVDTEELLQAVQADTRHRVDERAFARARLLDILIGDWDRSEDQWAWASFTNDSFTVYKPIPRDRDQAFVLMDGVFPWLFSRKWAARKYQGFSEEVHDIKGLNYNGRWIDRSFLSSLTLSDWKSIADSIRSSLTNEVIEAAINDLPASHIHGKDMIIKLEKRRDDLAKYAEEYYKLLAEEVDIVGSNDTEYFEVIRLNSDTTIVRMYRCNVLVSDGDESDKKQKHLELGEKELVYERAFRTDETDEIRLFGLDGNDIFEVRGKAGKGILLRIIGGEGYDRISERSEVKGPRKRTKVYDITERNEFVLGDEAKDLSSYDVRVNDYDREDFNYDEAGPKAIIDYNRDDGLFIGGGIYYKNYSFRKKPYSHLHELVGAASVKTGASYFRYNGDFVSLFRKWDLEVEALVTPYFATYFYGYGNETIKPAAEDESFNRVRINQTVITPAVKRWANKHHRFSVGPSYHYVEVIEKGEILAASPVVKLAAVNVAPHHFGSVKMNYTYRNVSAEPAPRQGMIWSSSALWSVSLDESRQVYSRISTEITGYIPLPLPLAPVLALRLGGASNTGQFEFYQANYLGGQGIEQGNLRGYRRFRFAGRTVAYQNTELRFKLLDVQAFGEAGVYGFIDHGRVWTDHESSSKLHRGYGGGIWAVPFNRFVITATYSASIEDHLVNLHLGFMF